MADFGHAGRKISRLQRAHSLQGEFSPADHHSPATQRTLPGTKLSQHRKNRPFRPIRGEQGELFPGADANNPSRENLFPQTATHQPRSAHSPVQNSPRTANYARFSPFEASRENFFPVQTQTTRAGRIFSRRPPPISHAAHTPRYKTLRAHGMQGHNRYKTLPTQQKTPISAHLARAGRKISRSRRKQPEQGESFPADHHSLATLGTLTGTKLSGQSPPQGQPVQNSPSTRRVRPQPVQNSPSTGKTAHFGPFSASRENFFPVQTQTTRAGRIFSRRPPPISHAAHTPRYKTLPASPTSRPNRYKTLRAIPASRPTGTKLSPHSKKHLFQPIRGEQGELFPGADANNPSRENLFPQTTTH